MSAEFAFEDDGGCLPYISPSPRLQILCDFLTQCRCSSWLRIEDIKYSYHIIRDDRREWAVRRLCCDRCHRAQVAASSAVP